MKMYYSLETEYGAEDELYKAIFTLDKPRAEELKANGVTLTENVKRTLVNGGGSLLSGSPASRFWYAYLTDLGNYGKEDFVYVSRAFFEETNAPLYYSDSVCQVISNFFFSPAVFTCLLECYDLKKLNKTHTLRELIRKNNVPLLQLCTEHGWLKQPKKRDEMIEFANKENKTECTAFLLEFKNKNFDLAAERVKAEKKLEQELNAAPDSVSELKKLWSFKKREDGGLIITSYKGTRGEIIVPSKIGKSDVVEIGGYAFAASAPRIKIEQRDFRRKEITRVVLPDTVKIIGEDVFSSCEALKEVNIPNGVVEIGKNAFCSCRKVTEFIVPETVKKMGSMAFTGCTALRSVKLPESTTEISDYMFTNCQDLQEIKLPAAIQGIGIRAFAFCTSLEEIVIPEGTAEIERQAFMNCDQLKTVVIPASVKSMKNFTYRGHAPETVFQDSPNVTAVVEPKSYAEKYCKRNGIKYTYRENKNK